MENKEEIIKFINNNKHLIDDGDFVTLFGEAIHLHDSFKYYGVSFDPNDLLALLHPYLNIHTAAKLADMYRDFVYFWINFIVNNSSVKYMRKLQGKDISFNDFENFIYGFVVEPSKSNWMDNIIHLKTSIKHL